VIKHIASYNEEVKVVVLGNAPKNAKYTSWQIQKEILDIMACNVQKAICNEIGDAEFCIIVDESRKEQITLVRFVDRDGLLGSVFLI
jgi:chromosomal replication initiation ATPase DnaA